MDSQPNRADMLAWWGENIPFISDKNSFGSLFYLGPYLNLLPIIGAVLIFIQQKKSMPEDMSDEQRQQYQIMKFMTGFMVIMFYKIPAGLSLYFIVSSLWGLAERRLVKKHIDARAADRAAGKVQKPKAKRRRAGVGWRCGGSACCAKHQRSSSPSRRYAVTLQVDDTIVALSSASGPGGRAIVRLSGPRSLEVAQAVFRDSDAGDCRGIFTGQLVLPEIDAPLPAHLYHFPAPHSVTGQSVIELHLISSPPLVDLLLAELMRHGGAGGWARRILAPWLLGREDRSAASGSNRRRDRCQRSR